MFEEMAEGVTRVSWRSKNPAVDVSALAKALGGGGHRAAAGARVPGTPLGVQRRVLAAVRKSLDAAR